MAEEFNSDQLIEEVKKLVEKKTTKLTADEKADFLDSLYDSVGEWADAAHDLADEEGNPEE